MTEKPANFDDASYIAEELKKQQHSLYLTTLYFDENKQAAARSILTLYTELRKIAETISEPMLGEIRTTWWRDNIISADIEKAGSPLAREIIRAIDCHKLDKESFVTLLEGFTQDLYVQIYETSDDLYGYLDQTSGAFFKILSCLAGHEPNKPLIISAGRSYGLSQNLYETPITLQRHKHYWTASLLEKHTATTQNILEKNFNTEIKKLYQDSYDSILMELDKANGEIKQLEPQLKPAFTPLSLVRPWLKAVKKTDNPLSQIRHLPPLSFQWHLWKSARKGQF